MWIRRVGAELKALAYAPDSRTLYTVEGQRVSAWDMASRKPTRLFHLITQENYNTSEVFVTADGRYLVLNSYPTYLFWDLLNEQRLPDLLRGWRDSVPAPAGSTVRFLAVSQRVIKSHDPSTGKTRTLVGTVGGLGRLQCYAFTPDDKKILLNNYQRSIVLLDRATGTTTPVPQPSGGMPHTFRYSPDGNSLFWFQSRGIEIWDAASMSVRVPQFECGFSSFRVFAIHPREPIFAVLNSNSECTFRSLLTGEVIRTYKLELRGGRCIAFSPDGLTCAACGTGRQFVVFDVDL